MTNNSAAMRVVIAALIALVVAERLWRGIVSSSRCVRPLLSGFTGDAARGARPILNMTLLNVATGINGGCGRKGFGENPASIVFTFKDITGWMKGTEHIKGLELCFKDRDHLIENWEMLNPDGPAYAEASARQARERISNSK